VRTAVMLQTCLNTEMCASPLMRVGAAVQREELCFPLAFPVQPKAPMQEEEAEEAEVEAEEEEEAEAEEAEVEEEEEAEAEAASGATHATEAIVCMITAFGFICEAFQGPLPFHFSLPISCRVRWGKWLLCGPSFRMAGPPLACFSRE